MLFDDPIPRNLLRDKGRGVAPGLPVRMDVLVFVKGPLRFFQPEGMKILNGDAGAFQNPLRLKNPSQSAVTFLLRISLSMFISGGQRIDFAGLGSRGRNPKTPHHTVRSKTCSG
jgi:hypothetical protein